MDIPTALLTGGSRGLGRALARALNGRGWRLVVDGLDARRLAATVAALPRPEIVVALPGDVADPRHRGDLAAAVGDRLDLLVNNASDLGPSPLPALADLDADRFARILAVDTVAPLALFQAVLPMLRAGRGRVLDISSDAAVEAYEGWGGYGAAKAGLDQLTAVLAVEHPELRIYAVDPGDMRTDMHQAAFPGEDIGDRPEPESVVPTLLRLIDGELASGRYRAGDLAAATAAAASTATATAGGPR